MMDYREFGRSSGALEATKSFMSFFNLMGYARAWTYTIGAISFKPPSWCSTDFD